MADDIGTELAGWLQSRDLLVAMLDKDDRKAPRIHPAYLPQKAGERPTAIVYHLVSDVSEGYASGNGGVTTVSHAILQFDCYGPTPKLAGRLRQKLKAELDAKSRGQIGNLFATAIVHDGDRDETPDAPAGQEPNRFIRMCDYKISYQRPTS